MQHTENRQEDKVWLLIGVKQVVVIQVIAENMMVKEREVFDMSKKRI